MSYIFGKLWHSAIIWSIRKSFQCIPQGVRFLLAKQTRLSGTSDNESYTLQTTFWVLAVKSKIISKVLCHSWQKIFVIDNFFAEAVFESFKNRESCQKLVFMSMKPYPSFFVLHVLSMWNIIWINHERLLYKSPSEQWSSIDWCLGWKELICELVLDLFA